MFRGGSREILKLLSVCFAFCPNIFWCYSFGGGCMIINQEEKGKANLFSATFGWIANINGKTVTEQMLSEIKIVPSNLFFPLLPRTFFCTITWNKGLKNWNFVSLWRHIWRQEKPILVQQTAAIEHFLLPRSLKAQLLWIKVKQNCQNCSTAQSSHRTETERDKVC